MIVQLTGPVLAEVLIWGHDVATSNECGNIYKSVEGGVGEQATVMLDLVHRM
jgi:hypothetical protein